MCVLWIFLEIISAHFANICVFTQSGSKAAVRGFRRHFCIPFMTGPNLRESGPHRNNVGCRSMSGS